MFFRPGHKMLGATGNFRNFKNNIVNITGIINTVNGPSAGVPIMITHSPVGGEYLRASTNSTTNTQSYQAWFKNGVRRGFFGFGDTADDILFLQNEVATSTALSLVLATNSTQRMSVDGLGRFIWQAPSSTGQTSFTFNGINGNNVVAFVQAAGSGTAFGVAIKAGTTSADYAMLVQTQAAADIFRVRGDGKIFGQGAVAAANVDMSPDASSFTGTLTGFTALTGTVFWSKQGNQVTMTVPVLTGTSTATTMTLTGMPSSLFPARIQNGLMFTKNNATFGISPFQISTSGVITFSNGYGGTFPAAFTSGAANGLPLGGTFTYALN